MKIKYLHFLVILLFLSCKEEPIIFFQTSITELSANQKIDIEELSKLRLAFGKTVANAMEHPDFRNYIKNQSQTNRYRGFKEIVFGMHQDDLVVGDLTFRQMLAAAVDDEVDALFDGDLFDLILEKDPMVTIKIPDVFFDFEWNPIATIPLVYVRTPVGLSDNDFEDMAFHTSGYQERYQRFEFPKHFCITIKYSEDFLFYDPVTSKNEKKISIFEFVPQFRNCWEAIEASLPLIGRPIPNNLNSIYLNKRELYQLYLSTCQSSTEPIPECSENCPRDCAPLPQVKNVFSQMETTPFKRFRTGDESFIFRENYHFILSLETSDESFTAEYALLGLRKAQFFENEFTFTFENKEVFYDNLGSFKIPELSMVFEPQFANNVKTDFDLLLFKGWPENQQNELITIYLDEVVYEDLVVTTDIAPFDVNDQIPGRILVNPSQAIHHRSFQLDFCDEKDITHDLVNFKIKTSF